MIRSCKKSKTQLTYDGLVGTWNCDKFIFGGSAYSANVDAYTDYNGWKVKEGVIQHLKKKIMEQCPGLLAPIILSINVKTENIL